MTIALNIEGRTFRDVHGREVILRGINVTADAKLPTNPNQPSHIPTEFFDGDNVSFVGRPFPVQDADIHFLRLRNWGYNTIRYIFTWEALESKGPGLYDEEFIKSTIQTLQKAKEYGFMVFMDPHQDVWSRFSGGSGAPMWTLYAAGLNPKTFDVTEAALVHNTYPKPAEYPKMIWSTNYARLANQVMFTLFFAGRQFAPQAIIDDMNIQDYLQTHFINACKHLAQKIHEAEDLEDVTVIGWESLNEPNHGLCGMQKLDAIPSEQKLQKGTSPTAWQAILTGSGRACEIETWDFGGTGPYKTGKVLVDPKGIQAWLPANHDDSRYGWKRSPSWKLGTCLWAQHGVWDPSSDTLLKPDYFSKTPSGDMLDAEVFTNVYFMNYFRNYAKAVRSIHSTCILFCQPPVFVIPPKLKDTPDADPRLVYTPHFYDGITLMTKKWNRFWNIDVLGVLRGRYRTPALAIRIGETAIRNCFRDQLSAMKQEGIENIGETPCLFSEIGIPYDMDDKYAYKTGDYISQIRAMDANHFALEGAKLAFTLWNYCPLNNHEWGDQWNGEDLSIFGMDDTTPSVAYTTDDSNPDTLKNNRNSPTISRSPSSISMSTDGVSKGLLSGTGLRAAEAFIRPSPVKVAGDVLSWSFDLAHNTFHLKLEANTSTSEQFPTEVYIPSFHFSKSEMQVQVSGGRWTYDADTQYVRWWHLEGEQTMKVVGPKRMGMMGEDDGYLEMIRNYNCSVM